MSVAALLDRLENVRARGEGRWMARCPAHEDRNPSLAIRETSDGTVLIHCFAACGAADVVAAVGLTWADLYPEDLKNHNVPSRDRRHLHAAREALKLLANEATVLQLAADHLAGGGTLEEADRARLAQASDRIREAREWAA